MSPRACALATTAATPAALARSTASVSTKPPFFLTSSATLARDSALRATASTGCPRCASALVNAAPMPPDAPVTIAQPVPVMRTSIPRLLRALKRLLLPVRPRRCNCNANESVGLNLESERAAFERACDGQRQGGSGAQFAELALRRVARSSHPFVHRWNLSAFNVP